MMNKRGIVWDRKMLTIVRVSIKDLGFTSLSEVSL